MIEIPEGVYSETKVQKIGTMSTSRTQIIVDYYQCTQIDENTMNIQILDMYGAPMPLMEKVAIGEFLKRFTYDPDKFLNPKTSADLAADKAIATAEKHVARKEFNSAEYEYSKALKLDEENVRANFGLGKLYVETGEVDKAAEIFSGLAQQDNVLELSNKHIFNELGIELRGLKHYEQAIDFYRKALVLAQDDEHLLFNIARAYLEDGNKDIARDYLNRALVIDPQMKTAKMLLKTMENNS